MKTVRNQMLAKLHILLQQQGGTDYKMALYSGYGVESARDMTDAQLSDAIARLEDDNTYSAQRSRIDRNVDSSEIKKLRCEILSLITKSPRATNRNQRGLGIPNDWAIINPFIVHHAGAILYSLSLVDLHTFKKKLFGIRESGWSYKAPAEQCPAIAAPPSPVRSSIASSQWPQSEKMFYIIVSPTILS